MLLLSVRRCHYQHPCRVTASYLPPIIFSQPEDLRFVRALTQYLSVTEMACPAETLIARQSRASVVRTVCAIDPDRHLELGAGGDRVAKHRAGVS